MRQAVLEAVAYADIFDYPLTGTEVHRYLIGVHALRAEVDATLAALAEDRLARRDDYYTLAGREHLVDVRRRRSAVAARLWPLAVYYGRILAGLPFVRMVAVTGALALDNVDAGSDIDFLIVATAGRVWVSRGAAGLLRRAAQLRGSRLCPNYVISERALVIEDRNLYTAHELLQMVPLMGYDVYRRMLASNDWAADFLPNAGCVGHSRLSEPGRRPPLSRLAETALRTRFGGWLDRVERERVRRKMLPRIENHVEVVYSDDCCKAHTDAHGQRILAAFASRLEGDTLCAALRNGANGAR